jgi:hypothetical protein
MPLSIHASSAAGIRRLILTIDGEPVIDQSPGSVKQEVDADYDWDTTHYVGSSGLARNRKYTVEVRAVSNSGAEDQETLTAVVNNQPSAPSGLAASVTGRKVTLAWDVNPEPDITGYRVERFFGNEYVEVKTVTATTFTESRGSGRYSYRIVALRHSEVAPSGLESPPSAESTVTIAASSSGASGGGPGGKVSGDSTGGGRGVHSSGGGIGATGLPGGAALPGSLGLGEPPELPAAEWGSFKKRLPYKLPKGGVPLRASAVSKSGGGVQIIPPDGLRWVAMGLLLFAIAGLSRLMAMRIAPAPEPAKIEA